MSVQTATKNVSENPGAMGVTSPTDPKLQEQEVDRKLAFYGVIKAFADGRYPDNKQIDSTLRYVEEHAPFDESKLSAEGKTLLQDARDVIESVRVLVAEKNQDELIQNFLWAGRNGDISRGKAGKDAIPASEEERKEHADKAAQHARTLFTLIITNSEARKLASDAGIIGRDLFAQAAAKAAESARPDQERLQSVDEPAPADQWKGADGQIHGPDSTPQVELKFGKQKVKVDPRADPNDPDSLDVNGKAGGQVIDEKAREAEERKEQAKREAEEHAHDVQRRIDAVPDDAPDAEERKKQIAKEEGKTKVQVLKDKIPEEHRERVNEQYNKAKNHLKEQFPEERRDQWIYRLKKLLTEIQKHKEYQAAISYYLELFETYQGHAQDLSGTGAGAAKNLAADPNYSSATANFRTLLERFANNRSLEPVIDSVNQIYRDADNDQQLRDWFKKLDTYLRKALLEPGYVLKDQSDAEARQLRDEGKYFFQDKYRGHWDAFVDSITEWGKGFEEDSLNQRFGEDIKKLWKDLLLDAEGNYKFKPHLWNDLRDTIIPSVVQKIGYIPIPRIEYSDKAVDLVIENLVLQGSNLLPNVVEFEAQNFFKFSPYKTIKDTHSHTFKLGLSQIQADLRNVGFYFNKKSGFPKISDTGLADVFLGGKGISAKVVLKGGNEDKRHVFRVSSVKVNIDTLKFAIHDSKHDLLYKTIRPLATGLVKKQIAKALEHNITIALETLDSQLVQVNDRLNAAKEDENMDRTQVLKELFQRKERKGEEKARESKRIAEERQSQFNVALSSEKTIVHADPPSHFLAKQAERDRAVAKNPNAKPWSSEAFTIVHA